MTTIQVQLSQSDISKILEINPTLTSDYGSFLNSLFTSIGTLQGNSSINFTGFLLGTVGGNYYFSSNTHAVVTTSYATFTLDGPNLLSQTQAALASHSGTVNLTHVNVKFGSGANTIDFTGSVNLIDSPSGITSSGSLSSATWTFVPTQHQDVYGTSVSYTVNGNFSYLNGSIGSGTTSQILFSSNGFAGSSTINAAVNVSTVGTGLAFSGTINSVYSTYSNGDYLNEINLNLPTSAVFSLNPLPAGNNTVSGTYYGGGVAISTNSGTNSIAAGNGPTAISAINSQDTVTFKSSSSNYTITPETNGSWIISSPSTGEGPDTLTGISYASFSDGSILNLTNGHWNNGSSFIEITPVVGAGALAQFVDISIMDSAADVVAALDFIQPLVGTGHLVSIKLTDSGSPRLAITSAQLAADASAISTISSSYELSITAPSTSTVIAGASSALGNTVVFSGTGDQYTITPTSDGSGLIVSGNGITDQVSGVQALQFADHTDIVAAAPGPANAVTTGNVTELYAAVFGRTPDVGGLAFYQNYLKNNPSTPLVQYAEWFLSSSEYTAKHSYAQGSAGDTQFIDDSYQNLLHRTPSTDEVDFYLTNVLNKGVAGFTAGTQAYANAEFQAHATMLVYFSASAEFLSDVQATIQHPTSAQHWLVLL